MDPFFTALIAVVIAFPVLALAAFLMALGNRGRLKRLEHKLVSLEARLAGLAGEAPLAAAPSAKPQEAVPAAREPETAEEMAPPPPEPQPPAAPKAPLPSP